MLQALETNGIIPYRNRVRSLLQTGACPCAASVCFRTRLSCVNRLGVTGPEQRLGGFKESSPPVLVSPHRTTDNGGFTVLRLYGFGPSVPGWPPGNLANSGCLRLQSNLKRIMSMNLRAGRAAAAAVCESEPGTVACQPEARTCFSAGGLGRLGPPQSPYSDLESESRAEPA